MEIPDVVARRVVISGPALSLAARTVQPMALALHELMTNALAHGALASASGVLEIEWAIEDGRTLLHWHERGTLSSPVSCIEGLGLRLIRGVVERQLGGVLKLDWTNEGLNAQLSFATEGAPRAANDGRPRSFRSG
jgi:two-component sensor histidine kinase